MCNLAQTAINNSVRWLKSYPKSFTQISDIFVSSTKLKMSPGRIKFICHLMISLGILFGLVHPVFSESGPLPPVTPTKASDTQYNWQYFDGAASNPSSNISSDIDNQSSFSDLSKLCVAKLIVNNNSTGNEIYTNEIAATDSDSVNTDADLFSDNKRESKSSSRLMIVNNSLKVRRGEERSTDMNSTTLPIPLPTPSAENATALEGSVDPDLLEPVVTVQNGLLAANEIPSTITFSFQGTGSGEETCSGDWGYQTITYNQDISFEVTGINPTQVGDIVTYDLSRKQGTIRFYGAAEDNFYGEITILNFDRTRILDIQLTEGTFEYNATQCGNNYLIFPIPISIPEPPRPYTTYIQYSRNAGIIRNTVNMPYPWDANTGCLSNNYDVSGTDDFECGCSISLEPERNTIIPEDTMKVTAQADVDPDYPLQWSIVPIEDSEAKAEITSDGGLGKIATISDVSGKGWMLITVTNPNPQFTDCKREVRIKVGCDCDEESTCSTGNCNQKGCLSCGLSSIDARFSLGRTRQGRSAGNIFMEAEAPDCSNATPQILKAYAFGDETELLYDGGLLRQVVAPESFYDIVVIDDYSYNIFLYDIVYIGSKVGGFYEVVSGAMPDATWLVENPDASPTDCNRLKITQTKGTSVKEYEYIWNDVESRWELSLADGLQIKTRTEEMVSGNRVVTEIIKDGSDNIASTTETTYEEITVYGMPKEEIVQSITDPGNIALATTTTWYEDPCAVGSCGKVASRENPDGSWVKYEYDSLGRKSVEIRSRLDAPLSSTASSARAFYYDYTAQDAADTQAAEDQRIVRKVTEEILGNEVGRTYYVYNVAGDGTRTTTTERCVTPGAPYGDPTNLRTVEVTYPFVAGSVDSGRLQSLTYPDGRRDEYTYEYGTYSPNADPTLPGTFTAGAGTDQREIVVHGTETNPAGIANKTTREIGITNSLGDLLLQETEVFNGSTYEQIAWTIQIFDAFGHVVETHNHDGTQSETTWGCCAKESDTDTRGIVRNYSFDGLQRLEEEIKTAAPHDITTAYTYDAAGRQLTRTVSAGGLSLMTSNNYDTAGRIMDSTDAANLFTDYDYTLGGRITTVTRPGGATEITERYMDGRTKSITGSGVIHQYYTYGVNVDGTQWTQVNTGSPSSTRWEKTTTDMLGRTIEVERPGFTGIEITENQYNILGQLERTITSGLSDTLYEYDELGNQIRSGLDTDSNSLLEPGSNDRITDNETAYVFLSGFWWQESQQQVYAGDMDSTATTTSIQRNLVSGLGSGGLAAETLTIDIHGNETVSQVVINRSSKTETRTIDYPDSTVNAITMSTNGLLTSSQSKSGVTISYAYDALGRQTSVVDPRTGATTTQYNGLGQVELIEDPAGNGMEYQYDLDTGRKIVEINAMTKAVRYDYNDRGQVTHIWGDATYPVEYIYDGYGQMTEMHTFRSGSNWSDTIWPDGSTGTEDVTFWHYQDATGLLTAKEDNAGNSVTYTYATGGRLATRTWARTDSGSPISTTYSYDPDTGDLLTIDYSDVTPDITLTYNRLGAVETVTDAVGTRTFAYNTNLQLESEAITGLINKTLTRVYETGTVMGRPIGFDTGPDYSVTYGYEDTGRFNAVNWNAGTDSQTATYSYLADSDLIEQLSTDQGHLTTYTYEPDRNLRIQVRNEQGSTLISQYDYLYDALGRRTSVQNSGLAFDTAAFNLFDYNDRSELTESDRYTGSDTGSPTDPVQAEYQAYDYDPIGNRIQITEAADLGTYTANPLNQYDAHNPPGGGSNTYTYDLDGNLTAITGTANILYTYNAENRLISTEAQTPVNGDHKVEFTYDYMGRRVQKIVYAFEAGAWVLESEKLFVYDGWNVVCEITNKGTDTQEKHYIWGLDLSRSIGGAGGVGGLIASVEILASDFDADGDIDGTDLATLAYNPSLLDLLTFATTFGKPSGTFNYFYDGNGNVGQLVPADNEAIAAHYEYYPYGNTILGTGDMAAENPYRFSTKHFDSEAGLYYYGYRYYAPDMGRWLNRDPLGVRGGLNLYGFVGNDSLNLLDVLGLDIIDIKDDSGKVVGKLDSDWVNCLGYATFREGAVDPVSTGNLKDLMKALDYVCTKDIIADSCKKHCACDKYLMLYVYMYQQSDYNKIRQKYKGKDFYADPLWDASTFYDFDFHAIRGTEQGYEEQKSRQRKGSPKDKTSDPWEYIPNTRRPDYFPDRQTLGVYCCCGGNGDSNSQLKR